MLYKEYSISIAVLVISQLPWISEAMPGPDFRSQKCLTGNMTDVQSWVTDNGSLSKAVKSSESIDTSWRNNPRYIIEQNIKLWRSVKTIKYLSMAGCNLSSVPQVFQYRDSRDRCLSSTLTHISLYGNRFFESPTVFVLSDLDKQHVFDNLTEIAKWGAVFKKTKFPKLQELDLRSCSISYIVDDIFDNMTSLKSLYLSGNKIVHINVRTLSKLTNLIHLDLSRNEFIDEGLTNYPMMFENINEFSKLKALTSLDLSQTSIALNGHLLINALGPNISRLSLCYSNIKHLQAKAFKGTAIKYLDISGNPNILSNVHALAGIEDTLEVLYADNIKLNGLLNFQNCTKLKVLKLSSNEITVVIPSHIAKLRELEILDLDRNRIYTWFTDTFISLQKLKILSMKHNNINSIKTSMIKDLQNVPYIALSGNYFVCSCSVRDFFSIAHKNEYIKKQLFIYVKARNSYFDYVTAYDEYVSKVLERNVVTCKNCTDVRSFDALYRLIDYNDDAYSCLSINDGEMEKFYEVEPCDHSNRGIQFDDIITESENNVIVLVVLACLVLPLLLFLFAYRRNLRYFFISLKNSATLSLLSESNFDDETKIYNYDVFVSYCNEDRAWILDQLLPHVEKDCNVSVCLHERDFQVGLSILENIVSCMDRSRSIMLVISKKFLLSQWCQFEMHLAQHRLLETRREDLIIILLEDIPKKIRPNTLHYLILTKTYLQWVEEDAEKDIFWRRLKKCLIMKKMVQTENVSLA